MKTLLTACAALLAASTAVADPLKCDLSGYTAAAGLTATVEQDTLVVTWTGDQGSELRARYGIERGQPLIRGLAVRKRLGRGRSLARTSCPSTTSCPA